MAAILKFLDMENNEIELPIQFNGKLRATFSVSKDTDKDELLNIAKSQENVIKHIEGHEIVKEIVIPNKIVNIVIK